ncbi:MAG: hypothetical protein HOP28_03640 [Gemmatimonadales bacterium]|nr:hypothetical protein [Gemmatimonadales bacterium]
MKFGVLLVLTAVAVFPGSVEAQEPPDDPIRVQQLRGQIEQRFGEALKEQLGLTDEQATRLRMTLAALAVRRRGMEQEERTLRQALGAQLRPGIAANPDSVGKLVDALTAKRVEYALTFKDEMRELAAVLTPVQRGQYFLARERLMQRVQDLMDQRRAQRDPPARVPRRP